MLAVGRVFLFIYWWIWAHYANYSYTLEVIKLQMVYYQMYGKNYDKTIIRSRRNFSIFYDLRSETTWWRLFYSSLLPLCLPEVPSHLLPSILNCTDWKNIAAQTKVEVQTWGSTCMIAKGKAKPSRMKYEWHLSISLPQVFINHSKVVTTPHETHYSPQKHTVWKDADNFRLMLMSSHIVKGPIPRLLTDDTQTGYSL